MGVSYSREQRQYAKESGAKYLATVDITPVGNQGVQCLVQCVTSPEAKNILDCAFALACGTLETYASRIALSLDDRYEVPIDKLNNLIDEIKYLDPSIMQRRAISALLVKAAMQISTPAVTQSDEEGGQE